MSKLRKCPFCGSNVVLEVRKSPVKYLDKVAHIYCPDDGCGADFWFYGAEHDTEEMTRRFNKREGEGQ